MPVTLSTSLVFIDRTVAGYQTLIDGVSSSSTVVLLEPDLDGVEQITNALLRHINVNHIYIVAHGEPGCLRLGSTHLTSATIAHYIHLLHQWSGVLTKDANIVLYACQVAAGADGEQFVQQLSTITGAAVAASKQFVGHAALGGNWDLDYQTGAIAPQLAFQPNALEAYSGVLALGIPNLVYGVVGTEIRVLDLATGSSTPVGTLEFQTFALAREATSGLIYYVESAPNANGGRVAFWNPDTNTNEVLTGPTGGRTGVNTLFLKLAQSTSGLIYALNASDTILYTINQNTGVATPINGTPANSSISGGGFSAGSGDIAFDPNNPNRLFISVVGGFGFRLFTVDVSNPALTATFIGTAATLTNTGAGSLAFGQDGELYVTSNVGGVNNLYRLNQTNATPTLIGSTGASFDDFASLPTPTASVDISVGGGGDGRDTITPGSPITYTVTVSSPSSTVDLRNISVAALIPPGVTGVNWTATIVGGGSFPTPADQSGNTNNINGRVNLNAGASVVYTITGVVSPNATVGDVLTATTTVTIPTGINDPNFANNTLTDTTTIVAQSSLPPDTTPVSATTSPGAVVNLPPLSGTDPDGTIASFTILTVPPAAQGTLFLGNPTSGGTPITAGRTIPPNQANQIFFQATNTFTGVSLTYTTTDNSGAADPTPATITLSSSGTTPPPGEPGEPGDDECEPGIRRRGNGGNNVLRGTPDEDTLIGLAGNDRLYGLDCGDLLDGGTGQDILWGGGKRDTLLGRRGNDHLIGGSGSDRLNGGLGNDRAEGGPGNDSIRGGFGRDLMLGGNGSDQITGNLGDDRMFGQRSDDDLTGGVGRDRMNGGAGNDFMVGRQGSDRMVGGGNADTLSGNLGRDFLDGRSGDDNLNGGFGNDRLLGRGGDDQLNGGRGNDILRGGRGGDFLNGRQNRDFLQGGAGSDVLQGGVGRDRLRGGGSQDTLNAGFGGDVVIGGFAADILTGGSGRDRFVYLSRRDRGDTITDFSQNTDLINLSRLLRSPRYGRANKFAAYIRLNQVGADTVVRFDINGDRSGGLKNFVILENVSSDTITARSFIL